MIIKAESHKIFSEIYCPIMPAPLELFFGDGCRSDQEQHHKTRTYETNVNLLLSVRGISGYYRVYYTPTRNVKPTDKNIKKRSTYMMTPLSNGAGDCLYKKSIHPPFAIKGHRFLPT